MAFHDPLRHALHSHSAGVHDAGAPASPAAVAALAARLERPLPADYADFLLSWNGVSLFCEFITIYPTDRVERVGPAADRLRIGETPEGALWMDPAGVVRLVNEDAPDPLVAGTSLSGWFAATLARETLILDRYGEFCEVFNEDGSLLETVRRKRVRAGRKHDPTASLYLLEEAELLLEDGKPGPALPLLMQAVAADPQAGPAFELLASLHRQAGRTEEAEQASLRAAEATWDPALRASRLLDAALCSPAERQRLHADRALAADPAHGETLLAQARELLAQGEAEEAGRLQQRLSVLLGNQPGALQDRAAELGRDVRTRAALRIL